MKHAKAFHPSPFSCSCRMRRGMPVAFRGDRPVHPSNRTPVACDGLCPGRSVWCSELSAGRRKAGVPLAPLHYPGGNSAKTRSPVGASANMPVACLLDDWKAAGMEADCLSRLTCQFLSNGIKGGARSLVVLYFFQKKHNTIPASGI